MQPSDKFGFLSSGCTAPPSFLVRGGDGQRPKPSAGKSGAAKKSVSQGCPSIPTGLFLSFFPFFFGPTCFCNVRGNELALLIMIFLAMGRGGDVDVEAAENLSMRLSLARLCAKKASGSQQRTLWPRYKEEDSYVGSSVMSKLIHYFISMFLTSCKQCIAQLWLNHSDTRDQQTNQTPRCGQARNNGLARLRGIDSESTKTPQSRKASSKGLGAGGVCLLAELRTSSMASEKRAVVSEAMIDRERRLG